MARVPQVRDHQARTVETSESRITIRETLDGLGIYNPARRNILTILFLMLWLTGWAFGEYFALTEIFRGGNLAGSAFLLVWVTFWTFGGLFAAGTILWKLFGSERLFVTAGTLVHSVGLGPFRRKRVYGPGEVGGFRLATIGGPRNGAGQGAILYHARGGHRSFGIGMTKEEAEASLAAIRRALPSEDDADEPRPLAGMI